MSHDEQRIHEALLRASRDGEAAVAAAHAEAQAAGARLAGSLDALNRGAEIALSNRLEALAAPYRAGRG